MRFLVIYNGPLSPDGGSSGTVWQSSEALRRLGHEVDVIGENGIRRSVSHPNLHYAFELPRSILEATRARVARERYDVIIISQPYGYLVGKWLHRAGNAPLYLHRSHGHELAVASQFDAARGIWPGESRARRRQLATRALSLRLNQQARLALKYADGTIVPSEFDRDYLINREGVEPDRVRLIHHAAIPSYLNSQPAPYTAARHYRLLYVGNFTRLKGGEILWQVANTLLRRFPELCVTFVTGPGDRGRVLAGLDRELVGRAAVVDWVDQKALMEIYDQHGLQIIPSLYEGAGKSHYEGMSRGLCLVCSDVGAMRDSITTGQNGWLVPPGSVEGFVEALSNLIRRFDLAKSVSERARARSLDFTWDRYAAETVQYAIDLLARDPAASLQSAARERASMAAQE